MMKTKPPLKTAGAVTVLAAVVMAVIAFGIGGDADKQDRVARGAAPDDVLLRYPDGWKELSAKQLGERKGVVGLKRKDDSAMVLVEARGPLKGGLTKTGRELIALLDKRMDDFKLVSAKKVRMQAGTALSVTFTRAKRGQIQNLVVVPSGDRSYTLNSVVAGDKKAAARDVAKIVSSFDPGK